jgi:PAS domain S-box-containing protein
MLGYDVCRQIKTNPQTSHIPVLQTSASFTRVSDKTVGLEAGADAYLIAPFEPEELIATVRALVRVREAEKNAKVHAQQWQATFEAIRDAICLVNEQGQIERSNSAFQALIAENSETTGLDFIEFARKANVPQDVYLSAIKQKERQVVYYETKGRWYELRVDPLPLDSSEVRAVISWADVTEIKKAAASIQKHNEELEERITARTADLAASVRELEAFTYSIAHDLRGPLRAIEGFTGALLDSIEEPLSKEAEGFAEKIQSAAMRMDELIQDLLQYARLGQSGTERAKVDTLGVIQRASEQAIEVSGKKVALELPPTMPAVLASEILLRQVVINIVDNAIKYQAGDRQPSIVISAVEQPDSVRLNFRDNGIGIDPKHFDRIFKVFERLHASNVYPGTGIGLAIVRRSIELMGGKCGVESTLGQGSTFWIELPAARW